MTQFDLEKLDEGTWFTFCESRIDNNGETIFDDPKEGAGKVCLRQAGFDILEDIRRECGGKIKREFVLNPKTRSMEPVEYRQQTDAERKRDREMLWDYVIVGWEGLKDKNEIDIEINIENKMKLISIPMFSRFVTRCLDLLDGQKTVTEKN